MQKYTQNLSWTSLNILEYLERVFYARLKNRYTIIYMYVWRYYLNRFDRRMFAFVHFPVVYLFLYGP